VKIVSYTFIEHYHMAGMTPAFLSPGLWFVLMACLSIEDRRKMFQCGEFARIVRRLKCQMFILFAQH